MQPKRGSNLTTYKFRNILIFLLIITLFCSFVYAGTEIIDNPDLTKSFTISDESVWSGKLDNSVDSLVYNLEDKQAIIYLKDVTFLGVDAADSTNRYVSFTKSDEGIVFAFEQYYNIFGSEVKIDESIDLEKETPAQVCYGLENANKPILQCDKYNFDKLICEEEFKETEYKTDESGCFYPTHFSAYLVSTSDIENVAMDIITPTLFAIGTCDETTDDSILELRYVNGSVKCNVTVDSNNGGCTTWNPISVLGLNESLLAYGWTNGTSAMVKEYDTNCNAYTSTKIVDGSTNNGRTIDLSYVNTSAYQSSWYDRTGTGFLNTQLYDYSANTIGGMININSTLGTSSYESSCDFANTTLESCIWWYLPTANYAASYRLVDIFGNNYSLPINIQNTGAGAVDSSLEMSIAFTNQSLFAIGIGNQTKNRVKFYDYSGIITTKTLLGASGGSVYLKRYNDTTIFTASVDTVNNKIYYQLIDYKGNSIGTNITRDNVDDAAYFDVLASNYNSGTKVINNNLVISFKNATGTFTETFYPNFTQWNGITGVPRLTINSPVDNDQALNTLTDTLNVSVDQYNASIWFTINGGTTNTTICNQATYNCAENQTTFNYPNQGYFNLTVWANTSNGTLASKTSTNILVTNMTQLTNNSVIADIFGYKHSGTIYAWGLPQIRWNITTLIAGRQIKYAAMNVYDNYNNRHGEFNITYWRVNNQTWTESLTTDGWDAMNLSLTNNTNLTIIVAEDTWLSVDISEAIKTDYGLNNYSTVRLFRPKPPVSTFPLSTFIETVYNTNPMDWGEGATSGAGVISILDRTTGNLSLNITYEPLELDVPPTITIVSPANTTYSQTTMDFNISSSEAVSYCIVSLNNYATNNSLTISGTTGNYTNSSIGASSYKADFWCNDTSNNAGRAQVNFTIVAIDNEYPKFADYSDDNASWENTGNASFWVNVTSTNGTVYLQINSQNYTALNTTYLTQYNYTILNLPAGVYSYQWLSYGNGTQKNLNISSTRYYTVNNTDALYPIFANYADNNGTFTGYGNATFLVNITNSNNTVYLQINGNNYSATNTTLTQYNVTVLNLINNTYAYQWLSWGNGTNRNFNISDTNYYTVKTDTIRPVFSNYADNNGTITGSGNAIFIVNISNTNGTVLLEVNGVNYTATNTSLTQYNTSVSLTNNTYSYYWTAWGNGSNNLKNISATRYYTVNSDLVYASFSNYFETPNNNSAFISGQTYQFNATILNSNGTAFLNFDGVNYTSTNLSNVFSSSITGISTGTHYYYWIAYSNGSTHHISVDSIRDYVLTTSYELTITPDYTYPLVTANTVDELNSFDIFLYDNVDTEIDLNITPSIQSSSYFTLSSSKYLAKINSSDNYTNPVHFVISINASSSVPTGLYSGNISIKNSTYGIDRYVYFTYGIAPPAGVVLITKSGISCNDDWANNCVSNPLDLQRNSYTTLTFTINNTGSFPLSDCSPHMSGDLNISWVTFDNNLFDVFSLSSQDVTMTIFPTSAVAIQPYYGYFYVSCLGADIANNPTSSNTSNQPYFQVNVLTEGGGASGGGGGDQLFSIIGTNQTSCGDGVCQNLGNSAGLNETFYNCAVDCSGFNLDPLLFCLSSKPEEKSKCMLNQSYGLLIIIGIVLFFVILSILFTGKKNKKENGFFMMIQNKLKRKRR